MNVIETAETESNQDEQSPSNQIITTPPAGALRQTFDSQVNSVILLLKINQKLFIVGRRIPLALDSMVQKPAQKFHPDIFGF